MSQSLCIEKRPSSRSRRLKLLPRFGFYVDFAGYQMSYRQVPLLETLLNMKSKKSFNMDSLVRITKQQINEIKFKRVQ